jgi:hypothetical protein
MIVIRQFYDISHLYTQTLKQLPLNEELNWAKTLANTE